MANQDKPTSLISSLHDLYARVAVQLWRWRINTYHKDLGQNLDADISHLLSGHVDRLSANGKAGQQRLSAAGETADAVVTDNPDVTPPSLYPENSLLLGRVLSGLSRQFKKQSVLTPVDLETGAKLTKSTWDHIHAALRLARQGDERSARLHSDIANNAIREAGHYLPEDDYRDLVKAVTEYLQQHPV